jgi:hypothetical protein
LSLFPFLFEEILKEFFDKPASKEIMFPTLLKCKWGVLFPNIAAECVRATARETASEYFIRGAVLVTAPVGSFASNGVFLFVQADAAGENELQRRGKHACLAAVFFVKI